MSTLHGEQNSNLYGMAQSLVLEGLISIEDIKPTVQAAKNSNKPFVEYLVDKRILTARQIAMAASKDFGVPFLDIEHLDTSYIPTDAVNESLIEKYQMLPLLKRDDVLFLAIADPSQQAELKEIQFHTGMHIRSVVVDVDKLKRSIEQMISTQSSRALDDFLDDGEQIDLDISLINSDEEDDKLDSGTDDAPIVKFVHKILLDAVTQGASDIHFEPYEKIYRVRFRVDGLLYDVAKPAVQMGNRISSRLKIMSQLDISERRIPQDGRFMMKVSRTRSIDFRVSTCPTVAGEKVVMRILDPSATHIGIEALGFNAMQQDVFMSAIHCPQGLILVTGPTGSGKTVTLYTALNLLNTPEKNISTAEDPVEIKVEGINQVNINVKTGLTFPAALRSFLRQDPDIIMVGEMRDLETAEIGIKAAQTGHMVLSTLHTNSAAETLTRLTNMGVPSYNISTSVNLIIAQRLVRRLCEKCKSAQKPSEEQLKAAGFELTETNLIIYEPQGCDACTQGYKGRVALYEMLPVTERISELILTNGNSLDIVRAAKQDGMMTLHDSGLEKIKLGLTSIAEVNRVIKD